MNSSLVIILSSLEFIHKVEAEEPTSLEKISHKLGAGFFSKGEGDYGGTSSMFPESHAVLVDRYYIVLFKT